MSAEAETYMLLANLAQTFGLVLFVAGFLSVVVYALWPSRRDMFERAAHAPLREED